VTNLKKMTGGAAMVEAAKANGIDTVFGLPGAQTYPIFDALHGTPEIKTVITRHEQGAAYMAYGYAKATGKPGAFSVVPGPGVLNASAALCTAAGGNVPLLCMTGQVPSQFLGSGRGHLHELSDQAGTLRTIIKYADRIDNPVNSFKQMNEAFRVMLSDRPGPVSLEMCWDTMGQEWEVEVEAGNSQIDLPEINEDSLDAAADLIANSKNIMIMSGSGAQHASKEVRELSSTLGATATSLRSGRGVVSEDSDWGVSSAAAMELWESTDLLIGIGSRLEMQYMRWLSMMEYYDKPPENGPKLIRIDVDPKEMIRLKPHVGVVADAKEGVSALIEKVIKRGFNKGDLDRVKSAKVKARNDIQEIQPQLAYLDVIREVLPRDGFFVEELCQAGFTSYYGFPIYEPRTYVSSGFQGTLGFGFPTALGVKVAMPDRAVVSIIGDGGFLFAMSEMASAVQHNIGLVTIVFNNSSFGNVRRDQQERFNSNLIGADLVNPNFLKISEAFGVDGYSISQPTELKPILSKAIENNRPAIIEVKIERGTEVSPWKYIHKAVVAPDS
tara:strand:+ start:423 stop:2087 length:1665 start_codon:yes stop_codon:yes gene_type:complete